MDEIQRYRIASGDCSWPSPSGKIRQDPDGGLVRYTDHLKAVIPTPAARTTKPPEVDDYFYVKRNNYDDEEIAYIYTIDDPEKDDVIWKVAFVGESELFDFCDMKWRSVEPVAKPDKWGPIDG